MLIVIKEKTKVARLQVSWPDLTELQSRFIITSAYKICETRTTLCICMVLSKKQDRNSHIQLDSNHNA